MEYVSCLGWAHKCLQCCMSSSHHTQRIQTTHTDALSWHSTSHQLTSVPLLTPYATHSSDAGIQFARSAPHRKHGCCYGVCLLQRLRWVLARCSCSDGLIDEEHGLEGNLQMSLIRLLIVLLFSSVKRSGRHSAKTTHQIAYQIA